MTIAAPTIFPIRHDWAQPFRVTREWSTDVQTGKDGTEVRASLRSVPHISMQMHCQFNTEMGAGKLLATWRGALQPLRYYAPLWCDVTELTSGISAGSGSIPCDTTDRPFLESGGYAMLWREVQGTDTPVAEIVTVDVITDDDFTIVGTTANDYSAGPTKVVPCRVMWLKMPINPAWQSGRIAGVDLSFVEEVPQAAYQLSDTAGTSVADSLEIVALDATGQGYSGVGAVSTLLAIVKDGAGIPILSATVAWAGSDANVVVTPSADTMTARLDHESVFGSGSVTATLGALSATLNL